MPCLFVEAYMARQGVARQKKFYYDQFSRHMGIAQAARRVQASLQGVRPILAGRSRGAVKSFPGDGPVMLASLAGRTKHMTITRPSPGENRITTP